MRKLVSKKCLISFNCAIPKHCKMFCVNTFFSAVFPSTRRRHPSSTYIPNEFAAPPSGGQPTRIASGIQGIRLPPSSGHHHLGGSSSSNGSSHPRLPAMMPSAAAAAASRNGYPDRVPPIQRYQQPFMNLGAEPMSARKANG